jgi:hypothetical protein
MVGQGGAVNRELRPAGKHSYYQEDDTYFLLLAGSLELSDAIAIHDQLALILQEHGRLFVVVDGRRGDRQGSSKPDVRRYIADWNRRHRATGVAVFGDHGPITRTVMTMIFAAIRVFRSDALPLALVQDEAEARAWIAAERTKLLRAPDGPSA